MKKILTIIFFIFTVTISLWVFPSKSAELRLIPDHGGLNTRVPVIPPSDTGAKGNAVNFEKVNFTYRLKPHLKFKGKGMIELYVRDNKRREEKVLIELTSNNHQFLRFGVSKASLGRVPFFEYISEKGKSKRVNLKTTISTEWKKVKITWDGLKANFTVDDLSVELPIKTSFSPDEFTVLSWSIDELLITANNGSASIDWENDYFTRLNVTNNGSLSVQVTGFDTYVISSDASHRDYPVFMISNSTSESTKLKFKFSLKSEVNHFNQEWEDEIQVSEHDTREYYLKFPFPLKNDIYHLNYSIEGRDIQTSAQKNFVYVNHLDEQPGESKFGLHNFRAHDFGYWPDALPIDIAHRYLRWGYVEGPAWNRDYNGDWGISPNLTPDNWNWNQYLDWQILAGNRVLICVQSSPLLDRFREYPYKVKMEKRIWGTTGGFPRLDLFEHFMEEAAKRYQGKVELWEIENEPNSSYMPQNPEDYWKIAKTVYDKVKKYTPNAKVFAISGTSNFPQWMEKALDAGKENKFYDGISWHTYSNATPDKSGLKELIIDAKKLIAPNTPLINTETGITVAKREVVDRPLSQEYVNEMITQAHPAFVSRGGWPGKILSEYQGSSGIVKNIIINFLTGVESFTFFGWSTSEPKINGDWMKTDKTPGFSILSVTRNGERTPNLLTLAIAISTVQFEPVNLKANKKEISFYGVQGGIFSKKGGGKLLTLWSPTGGSSALIESREDKLDAYTLWGKHSILKPVGKSSHGGNLFHLELNEYPVYLQTNKEDVSFVPSPIAKINVTSNDENSGNITINLINYSDTPLNLKITPAKVQNIEFNSKTEKISMKAKQSRSVSINYSSIDKTISKANLNVPFQIYQEGIGDFNFKVNLKTQKHIVLPKIPNDVELTELGSLSNQMIKNKLDTVDKVTIGRPPKFASIQEDYFWGGKEELSADIYNAYNDKGFYYYLKVRDKITRKPKNWPNINGTSVELFVDFRSKKNGFGTNRYSRGVYQILALPATEKNGKVNIWSPQSEDIIAQGVKAVGGPDGEGRYWLSIFIPWSIGTTSKIPSNISFDLAVNGGFAKKDIRKTQMVLFGNAQNFRDTSGFRKAVIEK